MAEAGKAGGQPVADSNGATAAGASGTDGQSATSTQPTDSGAGKGTQETFLSTFDPKDLDGKPELQAAYKQMLGDYTRKTQEIRSAKQKLDQYDELMRDPLSSAQKYLKEMGYHVVQGSPETTDKPWEPKTWDDVQKLIRDEAEKIANQRTRPLQNEVKKLAQQSIEARLDSSHPDWRTYEDQMVSTLQEHPSLARDPDLLYRMSVPTEIQESRAMKKALEKLKKEGDSSSVSGATTRPASTSKRPEGKLSLDEAWQVARKELISQGQMPS